MKITASSRAELLRLLSRFSGLGILVLADLVADEYVYGEIARVSREAPVLILKQRERQILPGGGANAANNLLDLGARVELAGAVGADERGEALVRTFHEKGASTRHVLGVRGYETPTKSRILAGLAHWQRQQIVRLDREPADPLHRAARTRLVRNLLPLVPRAQGLLVSDYGYGAADPRDLAPLLARAAKLRLVTTLDSRFRLLGFSGFTAATPNEPELEDAFGAKVGNDPSALERLGRRALSRMKLQALLLTRGRDGMVLFERGRKTAWLPIFGSEAAVDVTGAGDTVIAAFTLALAAGADFLGAAQLANCAAGLVVMKRGTSTVKASEIAEAIRNA
jgi:D-glycero-beta-D-manno-heptose-7-phosphate kinase